MALSDYKISNTDVSGKGVQSAPDRLSGTAAENKALFDRLIAEVVKEKLNALIEELAAELSGKLTAPQNTGSAGQYLRTDGQGGYQWGTPSGSGDMLQSQYDSDGDGRVDQAERALNAALADALATARPLKISDEAGHEGADAYFDGSDGVTLPLPATIRVEVQGNAATASKAAALATARKIGNADFDGTENVTLSDMGAAAAVHSHSNYLPLSGGTIGGRLTLNGTLVGKSGVTYGTAFPGSPTAGQIFFRKV